MGAHRPSKASVRKSSSNQLMRPAGPAWLAPPNDIMFKKRSNPGTPNLLNGGAFPGQPAGFNMSMLSSMGFSNDAQMLAIQLMMNGLMQPAGAAKENTPPPPQQQQQPRSQSPAGSSSNWRASSTSRFPGSALRSAKTVPKSAGLKSGGLKSAASVSSGSGVTPKEEDIDPQLLEDVPRVVEEPAPAQIYAVFRGDGLEGYDQVG